MRGQHEKTDMDPKYAAYFGAALVVAGFAIYAGLWWMFHHFERQQAGRETQPALIDVNRPTPEPRLQIDPQGELEELRRQENEILTTYRWIDRERGTARIPIDRAMQIFLERQKK